MKVLIVATIHIIAVVILLKEKYIMTDNILSNTNIDDNIVDYAYAFRQIIKIIAEV